MKLVADLHIPFLSGVFEPYFDEVIYLPANEINRSVVKNADALLIRTRTICNKDLLAGSAVKFIGSATIGYDHIDVEYCNRNGIVWTNSSGCNADAVLQWVLSALFYLQNKEGIDLSAKVFGIVGVGNVGGRVAKALKNLGYNILCCDPPRVDKEGVKGFVDFEYITQHADIISFHVPLDTSGEYKTYHMGDEAFFSNLNPDTFIINTSRGEVVNTMSILKAYNTRRIQGYAFDVWENEPNINRELVSNARLATPHIAGYSLEGKINGTKMVVERLSQFFNLGLNNWIPYPNPTKEKVVLSNLNKINEFIEKTYDIESDSNMFKSNPIDFEKFRNTYNYRRDFTGHKIVTVEESLGQILSKMGFVVSSK